MEEGHWLAVCSWWPDPPTDELPSWCTWQPVPPEPWLRTKARALVRPRWDVTRIGWEPAPGAIAVADDSLSFPAVRNAHPSVLTQHHLTRLDCAAIGRTEPPDRQDIRAQRRNANEADVVLAYSERVAWALGVPALPVPIAYDSPTEALSPIEAPVAALVANWDWPPNLMALRSLLEAWPDVRELVPGATLLLGGRHFDRTGIGTLPGVESVGAVERSVDILARASVLAFPCPASSAPKMKVLEALGLGLPVVTTPAGIEGVAVAPGEGVVVSPPSGFAHALATTLADVERRAAMAAAGRRAVLNRHSPRPAARARVAALAWALRSPGSPGLTALRRRLGVSSGSTT
jgi:glycosyltransferase involved in cell wall biosynthesis